MRGLLNCLATLALFVGAGCAADEDSEPSDDEQDPGEVDEGPQCPSSLKFTFLPGNRTDVGWTGVAHGSTFARDSFFRVAISECERDCTLCKFEGPIRDDTVNTQRCVSDTAIECSDSSECPPWACESASVGNDTLRFCANDRTRTCEADEDCGPAACEFFVGPPFPLVSPTNCLALYFRALDGEPPVSGLIDLRTGETQFDRFSAVSGTPGEGLAGACPKCIGDPRPNDGRKDGVCRQNDVGSPYPVLAYDKEQACDANGVGSSNIFDGSYSLDCSVNLGLGLNVGFENASSAGDRRVLSAAQPLCGNDTCWCGLCEGTFEPCGDSSDCAPSVECVAPQDDGAPIRPNQCAGGTCNWDDDISVGSCLVEGGTSTVACFPSAIGSQIVAPGGTEILSEQTSFRVDIGSISCQAPARSFDRSVLGPASDAVLGLPGIKLNALRFQVDVDD